MSHLRNYAFDPSQTVNEDELPEDMTMMDYDFWFERSWVDFVRLRPAPVRIPADSTGSQS